MSKYQTEEEKKIAQNVNYGLAFLEGQALMSFMLYIKNFDRGASKTYKLVYQLERWNKSFIERHLGLEVKEVSTYIYYYKINRAKNIGSRKTHKQIRIA